MLWQTLLLASALTVSPDLAVISFSGPDCPHCQKMEPILAQMEQQGIPVQNINVLEHPEMARRFQVQAIPTFVVVQQGRELNRLIGSASLEKMLSLLPRGETGVTVRGQSPAIHSANENPSSNGYLNEQLNGIFGKRPPANAVSSGTANTRPASSEVSGGSSVQRTAQQALAASVRLKVNDAKGHSLGSGTIIAQQGNAALVMTCGHIFRESKGEGEITVDLFYPQPHTVTGTLISYDDLRDIGLVSIETEHALKTIPIAPENYRVQPNSKVITVGCNSGNDPTVCNSHVKSINRYNGPPNIQVAGAPVDGRSGGGLISSEGFLVGVCNAADPEDDEGIYAALGTLHWQLAQVGLSSLYQRQQPAESPATEALADSSTATISLTDAHDEIPEMPARRVADSRVAQHNAGGVPRSLANSLPMNDASDAEIICIVRSKSHPERKNQIFVLDNVSSEFMQQVAASSHDPTVRADLQLQADRRAADAYVAPRTGDPVVRGQSYERR